MRVRVRVWLSVLAALAGVAGLVRVSPARETGAQGPTQPIAFSHKLHAGDQGIDCH